MILAPVPNQGSVSNWIGSLNDHAGCFRAVVTVGHWIIQCQNSQFKSCLQNECMHTCTHIHAHLCVCAHTHTQDHIYSQLWYIALCTSLGASVCLPRFLSLGSPRLRMVPVASTLPVLASPHDLSGPKANKIWPGNNVQYVHYFR